MMKYGTIKNSKIFVLFRVFLRISALTVGGGLTMLPLLTSEFSEKRNWISDAEMVDIIALVQSMPGIIAANMAVMIGFRVAGLPGVFAAVLGMMIPPFAVILLVGILFRSLTGSKTASHILLGVRASVCALIALSAWKMAKQVLKSVPAVILALLSFAVLTFLPWLNAVWVIIAGALAGLLLSFIPRLRKMNRKEGSGK